MRWTKYLAPGPFLLSAALLAVQNSVQAADDAKEEDGTSEAEDAKNDKEKSKKSKFIIGLDGELSAVANAGSNPLGGGFGLRLGRHHPFLGVLAFRSELGGGYNRLLSHDTGRVFAGGRLGFNFVVGVYAYGHAGVGWGVSKANFMYDVGAAVDLVVLNVVRPGLHLEYERIFNDIESVNAGLHIELAF